MNQTKYLDPRKTSSKVIFQKVINGTVKKKLLFVCLCVHIQMATETKRKYQIPRDGVTSYWNLTWVLGMELVLCKSKKFSYLLSHLSRPHNWSILNIINSERERKSHLNISLSFLSLKINFLTSKNMTEKLGDY